MLCLELERYLGVGGGGISSLVDSLITNSSRALSLDRIRSHNIYLFNNPGYLVGRYLSSYLMSISNENIIP
jgi:hypothetical protein